MTQVNPTVNNANTAQVEKVYRSLPSDTELQTCAHGWLKFKTGRKALGMKGKVDKTGSKNQYKTPLKRKNPTCILETIVTD